MKENRQSILRVSILAAIALLVIGVQLGIGFTRGAETPIQAAQVAYPIPQPPGKPAPGGDDAYPSGPAPRVIGAPALRPTIQDVAPGQAAFTKQDVEKYFADTQAKRNGATV